ncbi:hypothetical protein V6N13_057286 [Hibiscus sabdariffa]
MGLALVGMAEDRSLLWKYFHKCWNTTSTIETQELVDKATLPLTTPRRVFKSSAKDSTRRSVEITLQGGTHDLPAARAMPTTRALGGHRPLLRVGNRATGACFASSPDSDLEAFSHNPAHGSFAPLAFHPSTMTNCANQRRIPLVRTSSDSTIRRPGKALEGAVPSPSPGRHAATRSHRGSSSSSASVTDGFGTGTPVPSPQSQSFSQGYRSIFPTSLAYIVPSTRACSHWRPDADMRTTGRGRHSVLRIFKGRRGAPDTTRRAVVFRPLDPTSGRAVSRVGRPLNRKDNSSRGPRQRLWTP